MTRLSAALNSSDLEHHEQDCDVDMLQATGTTAIHRTLGVMIIEAKEGAAGEGSHAVARIKDLEDALRIHVKSWARSWRIRVDLVAVSTKIARELILDRCSVCQGRGVIPMKYDGTRMVAVSGDAEGVHDVECHVCHGSGAAKRDYHGRAKAAGMQDYTKRLAEWWEAVLGSCADAELDARRAIWRKLREKN
jgi:hypothetical protein